VLFEHHGLEQDISQIDFGIKLAAIDTVRLFGKARPIFPRVIEQS
jgi:hypothetical protein